MHTLYKVVSGPLLWIAFCLFIGGCIFRLWQLYSLARRKEAFIFSYFSFKYSLRSLAHWLTPFATVNMRKHPFMTVVSFAFHICLLLVPIFALSHIVLWEEAWGIQWWALPDGLADIMTLIVVTACILFLIRRLTRPEVRYVTSTSDFALLAVVAMPFITGFYCYHQWPGYQVALIAHMLSGEIMLIAIPFTRLSHMLTAIFTRSYMGSEFGGVRHAHDW